VEEKKTTGNIDVPLTRPDRVRIAADAMLWERLTQRD